MIKVYEYSRKVLRELHQVINSHKIKKLEKRRKGGGGGGFKKKKSTLSIRKFILGPGCLYT